MGKKVFSKFVFEGGRGGVFSITNSEEGIVFQFHAIYLLFFEICNQLSFMIKSKTFSALIAFSQNYLFIFTSIIFEKTVIIIFLISDQISPRLFG